MQKLLSSDVEKTGWKRSGNNTDFSTKQKLNRKDYGGPSDGPQIPQVYVIEAGEELGSFKDTATKQKLMNKTLKIETEVKKWKIECFGHYNWQ